MLKKKKLVDAINNFAKTSAINVIIVCDGREDSKVETIKKILSEHTENESDRKIVLIDPPHRGIRKCVLRVRVIQLLTILYI